VEPRRGTHEGVVNRDRMIERLAAETFDVLVIGGGATGLGCAVDAASRGYRTALIEAADFAAATSSRSTKLIHGGVRYLAQGNVSLVREALRERENLRRNAPQLVSDLEFLVPAYRMHEFPYYYGGLLLYDLLASGSSFGRSRPVSARAARERMPWLRREGLHGGVVYHDGQFDDARLAIVLAKTAARHGAALANYVRATEFLRSTGRIAGARAVDAESGRALEIRSRVTINATGIFADELRRLDRPSAANLLSQSRGTHIVVPGNRLPMREALLVPRTDDGRLLFVVPWHEHVVIGTTDVAAPQAELHPQPSEDEIDYLIAHVNRYVEQPVRRDEITSAWAGLRPLVDRKAVSSIAQSREHFVEIAPSGLVTIAGGKWTTYRKMAQDAVDAAIASGALTSAPCVTERLALVPEPEHVDEAYAIREEMARTADDVLARRTRLWFLDQAAAERARPRVEALLQQFSGAR
jgi:glycerol-3-phosphate dehydrogenase